ncbi:MAG: DUF2490 domain-containing protein [Bacteroidetes bacterium]|nr:DUF2490 domain-containing protein [Bacteroidota bacterium]
MLKRIYLSLVVFFTSEEVTYSQKQTTAFQQTWVAYLNQSRFSDKWGTWTDLHLRTRENYMDNLSQTIARFGLTYYVNNNTKLTAGYAYVSLYPWDNHKNVTQPEHRPWQQIQWHTNYPKLKLMQWLRLEERFKHKIKNDDELADGYNFNYRLRYNFYLAVPLSRRPFAPGTFSFVFNDELHINFGKEITYNYFDQNRLFVGFVYHTTKTDNIQFGYMNFFQQLPAGNQYKNIDVARFFYFHNLDFRRK